ncbi:MAG: hypothetical protein GY696_27615 [Gammaproteobacteria bacterium]|nr:hypothetical protein [Gammaproteobacteria bacterium]
MKNKHSYVSDIDYCDPNPCFKGECRSEGGSFKCNCSETGYTGEQCEQSRQT